MAQIFNQCRVRLRLAALVLGAACSFALSPVALALDSKDNAALKFWQAWAQISPEALAALGPIEAIAPAQSEWKLPAALASSGALDKSLIGALERAALMEKADFGVEYDQWPNTIVAHLSPMRSGAKLLAINARAALDAGNHADAARSIAAGFGMARHAAADGTMIGSLVGAAIFTMTDGVARFGSEQGLFDAADRATIRGALVGFDSKDAFGIRRAVSVERDLVIDWLRSVGGRGEKAQVTQRVLDALAPLVADGPELDPVRESLGGREDLESQLALYGLFYDQALAAWDQPDSARMLDELEKGAKSGAFGGIVQVFAPSLTRLQKRSVECGASLQASRDRFKE